MSRVQTLTRTISSDTIAATTAYATAAHLALHDYNFAASVTDKLSGSLSLAAGIFSSVLLASRLATSLQVFSQVCTSPQEFLSCRIKQCHVPKFVVDSGRLHRYLRTAGCILNNDVGTM